MTCVLDPKRAACRLRSEEDSTRRTPDLDDCRPNWSTSRGPIATSNTSSSRSSSYDRSSTTRWLPPSDTPANSTNSTAWNASSPPTTRLENSTMVTDHDDERDAITAAIQRLLDGRPTRSTGALTTQQLAAEAGVKRWVLTHKHVDLKGNSSAESPKRTASHPRSSIYTPAPSTPKPPLKPCGRTTTGSANASPSMPRSSTNCAPSWTGAPTPATSAAPSGASPPATPDERGSHGLPKDFKGTRSITRPGAVPRPGRPRSGVPGRPPTTLRPAPALLPIGPPQPGLLTRLHRGSEPFRHTPQKPASLRNLGRVSSPSSASSGICSFPTSRTTDRGDFRPRLQGRTCGRPARCPPVRAFCGSVLAAVRQAEVSLIANRLRGRGPGCSGSPCGRRLRPAGG